MVTYGALTTADEVLGGVDLRGRRFLITGISSGVGAETARVLAVRGGAVVGIARDPSRAGDSIDQTQRAAEKGGGSLEVLTGDLASLDSIRQCADQLMRDGRWFDVIFANAGVMATPGGRLVSLSSNGHQEADVDLDDPNFEHTEYNEWTAYGRSKTANSLFAVEFDRRHRDRGARACAVMPGTAMTPLLRHLSEEAQSKVFASIDSDRAAAGARPLALKSVGQMAASPVWAGLVAVAQEIGGRYTEDCHIADIVDRSGIGEGVRSYAIDPGRARLLWTRTEELVGEHFPSGSA